MLNLSQRKLLLFHPLDVSKKPLVKGERIFKDKALLLPLKGLKILFPIFIYKLKFC